MKIGTDIIQIDRIKQALQKDSDRFKRRFLNQSEIEIATKIDTIAGFWAAKEAISKALGCGIGGQLSFHDITIYKDQLGAPHFKLSDNAQQKHNIANSSISISHDGNFAIAIAAIETKAI